MWDWLKKFFGGKKQEEQPTQPAGKVGQSRPENTGETEKEGTSREQS